MERKKVLIAANPKSGSTDRTLLVRQLAKELQEDGFEAEIISDLDALQRISHRDSAEEKLHSVIGAGGDGTAAAVVSRIPSTIPFLPFPLGTENLLSRHFGIVAECQQARQILQQSKTIVIDAGEANGQIFLLMVGIGYDGQVVHEVHRARRGHIRPWTYWWPMLRVALTYRFPKVRYQAEGGKKEGVVEWLFAFNLPCYGGGLSIAPWANGTDHLLDVCTFRRGGLGRSLGYVYSLWRGRQRNHKDFETWQCDGLELSSDQEVHYQVDGDPGGLLPLRIRLLPERVRILIP